MHSHSPSNSESQSSESHEHDPEYEALLAANTLANAGVLGSIRNIGVGRQLLSAESSAPADSTLSKNEKRKRLKSGVRSGTVGSEWTLYLENDDDIPPKRRGSPFTNFGLASGTSFEGVRARTKSESALGTSEFGKEPGIKRSRSSTMAGLAGADGFTFNTPSSPPPPVPKLPKMKEVQKSEDWTLSLPILQPDKGEPVSQNSGGASLKSSKTLSNPVPTVPAASTATLIAGSDNTLMRSTRHTYPQPEVVVCIDGVEIEDDDDEIETTCADEEIVADSQATPFGLDIDSLELDDDDEDSLLDFSADTAVTGGPFLHPDHVHLSVPRVVSQGSGIESATWGSEIVDEAIRKRRRRFSDGLESLMAMAGVCVRMRVNADGESICVVDGQSVYTKCEDDEDDDVRTEETTSDATKENIARLDALSADLKRFNELLKEGVDASKRRPVLSAEACSPAITTKPMGLKQARSCGVLPSQGEVKPVPAGPLRLQQSIDGLQNVSPNPVSMVPIINTNVKKTLVDRPVSSSDLAVPSLVSTSPTSGLSSNTATTKIRPPLPFAPSSHSSRPTSRSAGLGIGHSTPSAHQPSTHGRATTGRAMSMSMPTVPKPSLPSSIASKIASANPVGVVGSGLKVGGNGRVICLSGSASSTHVANATSQCVLNTNVNISTERRAAIIATPDDFDECESSVSEEIADKGSKRNSISSFTSAETFFTSFSRSQAPTPPPNKNLLKKGHKHPFIDFGSNPDFSTPRATLIHGLSIVTTSAPDCRAIETGPSHNLVDDVYTPNSSALHTPLASSFPAPPPLPASLMSLGNSLNAVSRILAAANTAGQHMSRTANLYENYPPSATSTSSRLSSASEVSLATIVPLSNMEEISHTSEELISHATGRPEPEIDSESLCSRSFYSARTSFDA